jgi:hypothetical protein
MTGDLLPHGDPEHRTYRAPNGDIRCIHCPLEVGRPLVMPDYGMATMAGWSRPGLVQRWYLWRLRRRYRKIFREAATP